MNKRPGHVKVETEVAYCSFCDRVRTLRREEHQLGTLVRTIVTCETCHRTLSSTMGVAEVETPETAASVEPAAQAEEPTEPAVTAPRSTKRAPTGKTRPASTAATTTKARPKKTT
jgi:hypothetical protein